MAASKNSHVPKFGNWDRDNENVPYTAFFENARKEKARARMNPNDPEENPEAFIWGTPGLQSHGDSQPVRPPNHIEEQMGYYNPRGNDRNASDHRRGRSRKSTATSEFSSSDKNNSSDHHRRLKSGRKKGHGHGDGSNSFSPALPGHYSGQRSGNYPSDEHHHRAASVPKFGAWDEYDPKSGEGFTVIFNKVKEEKQIASSQFPIVPEPEQTNNYSDGQPKLNEGSWFRSKICCCCRRN